MSIRGGLDVPRAQITFDRVDRDSGQARRGRIVPATRAALRAWLDGLPGGQGGFAVEGWTGWRFVVEELPAAGFLAHLAEPAQTSSRGGPKRRATTDRTDARLRGEVLEQGRLPCAWIPPTWILDLRTTVRLGTRLVDQRTAFKQRIHAALFHHGLPRPTQGRLSGPPAAGWSSGVAAGWPAGAAGGVGPGRPPGRRGDPIDNGWGAGPPVRRRRPGGPGHRAGGHRVCRRRQA
jgi:hypothetical protein